MKWVCSVLYVVLEVIVPNPNLFHNDVLMFKTMKTGIFYGVRLLTFRSGEDGFLRVRKNPEGIFVYRIVIEKGMEKYTFTFLPGKTSCYSFSVNRFFTNLKSATFQDKISIFEVLINCR